MYIIGFVLGAIVVIFLLSRFVGATLFRKVTPPKKQAFSVAIAYIFATVLTGYGLANEGDPKFIEAAVAYGIASIFVLAIQLVVVIRK